MCDREIKVVGLGFALLRQDNGQQTTVGAVAGNMELRIHGSTEIWNYGKLASLCYAKTTDNGRGGAGSLLTTHSYSVC